jgi:hypothetical protein
VEFLQPGLFGKTGPADTAITLPETTLSWSASELAAGYEYCIDLSDNDACNSSWISVGTSTSAVLSGLSEGAVYHWQVRAVNVDGITYADDGEWWEFCPIPSAPYAFGKTAPDDESSATTHPSLSWEPSTFAEYYIYCVDTIDNGICDASWEYAGASTSAALSGLDPGQTYYWFVVAGNDYGTTYADDGTWWSFDTLPDPPAAFGKITPGIDGWAPFDPTLLWEAAAGADEYEYCLDTNDNGSCDASWLSTGGLTTDDVTGLSNNTTYFWQARAVNAGGTTYADDGTWWSFHTPTFADVPFDHVFWEEIEAFYAEGITTGCGVSPLIYCPESLVTRAAMAVFLLRAKYGGGYTPPPATHTFTDLPVTGKEWQEAWVDQFYLEGITTGCGTDPLIYCPEDPLTRAAMAVFILRTIEGPSYAPPPADHYFADMPVAGKEWMEPWVDEFYRRGITSGCGYDPLIYCPEDPVKRQAMAVFIVRAFGIPLP